MNLFKKKRSWGDRLLMALAVVWEFGWRAAAIRVALRRHQMKWVISLATVSSMGTLPMFYLWRHRAAAQAPGGARG